MGTGKSGGEREGELGDDTGDTGDAPCRVGHYRWDDVVQDPADVG